MKPQSSLKKSPTKAPAERVVKDIRRATRRDFSAEDKIRGLSSSGAENLYKIIDHWFSSKHRFAKR